MIKLKTIYIISFMLLLLTIIINNAYSNDITQSEDISQSEYNNQSEDNKQLDNNSKSEDNSQFNILQNIMNNTYSEDNDQINIRFANTLSVGYFSNNLYRKDIRTKHSTILDKPAFNIDEKFQIILSVGNKDEIETTNFCWMPVPNSLAYMSINLLYSHYENFAIRTGMGLEAGFGDYKNPFALIGISLVYLHDMVFSNKYNGADGDDSNDGSNSPLRDFSLFFNIGYKYDMHFFIDVSGALEALNYTNRLLKYTSYGNIEITLGYKKLIPLFFKYEAFVFFNDDNKIDYTAGIQYSYEHGIELYHIQYYGDSLGLSIGYSNYFERYIKKLLNDKQDGYDGDITIDEKKYHGGGITFDLMNAAKTFEFFGELHVLADKDYNWLTICKFGTTVYF